MSQHPDYVEYAFNVIRVINTEEWLQEDIEAFTQRWGGVDLATFAIGHTRSRWARDLLIPFLQSDDPGVR